MVAAQLVILTEKEFLDWGLWYVNLPFGKFHSYNIEQFTGWFGVKPKAVSRMWEDLQTTAIGAACIKAEKKNANCFLMTFYFTKNYPLGVVLAGQSKKIKAGTEKTAADWCWFFLKKLQALKMVKIVYPDKWTDPSSLIF